jgi:hypothetical protein
MNESNVPPTPSEGDAPPPQPPQEPPPPPARATTQAVPSDWGAGRIIAIVAGALLILISVGLLGAGGVAVWAGFQRDGGYVTTDVQEFSASGSALATDPVDLGSEGVSWVYSSDFLDSVRIRVTPTTSDQPLFVGIGRSAAVSGYLAGVSRTVISDFWGNDVKAVPGGAPESPPGDQDFWVASTHGSGTQTLVWDPSGGTWTAVVMNADGRRGLDVKADLGGRIPHLGWIALGLLLLGAILLAAGVLLIVFAVRRRRPAAAQPA